MTDLGPVDVKLGQLLSTRLNLLPPDYVEALSSLQSNVPPVAPAEIEAAIRQQLPQPPEAIFKTISYQAIAAGSIAQTHQATLKDGRQVAIEIQRPGIDDTMVYRPCLRHSNAFFMPTHLQPRFLPCPNPIFLVAILGTIVQALPVALLTWGEEFGWRRYLQIRLLANQPQRAAIATGLI